MLETIVTHPPSPSEIGAVRGVRGGNRLHQGSVRDRTFRWKLERGAKRNYQLLGRRLAAVNQCLYRNGANGQGLLHVLPTGEHRLITRGAQLAPVIVDSIAIQITKE